MVSVGLRPLTHGVGCCLQVDSVRIEFKCRPSIRCRREWLGVRKSPTHWVTRRVGSKCCEVFCIKVKGLTGSGEMGGKRWVFPYTEGGKLRVFSFTTAVGDRPQAGLDDGLGSMNIHVTGKLPAYLLFRSFPKNP